MKYLYSYNEIEKLLREEEALREASNVAIDDVLAIMQRELEVKGLGKDDRIWTWMSQEKKKEDAYDRAMQGI